MVQFPYGIINMPDIFLKEYSLFNIYVLYKQ